MVGDGWGHGLMEVRKKQDVNAVGIAMAMAMVIAIASAWRGHVMADLTLQLCLELQHNCDSASVSQHSKVEKGLFFFVSNFFVFMFLTFFRNMKP